MEKKREVEKEKIEIRPTVFFVFDIINYYLIKDKATFVKLMCRNNTSSKPIKVNNYQVHVKKFVHGTALDVLLLYNKVKKVFKQQKPCKDTQPKLSMTVLILKGQGLCTFLQLNIPVTKPNLV